MSFSPNVWAQLKNITCAEIVRALERDGWALDTTRGAIRIYYKAPNRRVSIHYHTGDRTYGPKLLQGLLADIGWSEAEMKALKLIK